MGWATASDAPAAVSPIETRVLAISFFMLPPKFVGGYQVIPISLGDNESDLRNTMLFNDLM
jgi:hypothetical protein